MSSRDRTKGLRATVIGETKALICERRRGSVRDNEKDQKKRHATPLALLASGNSAYRDYLCTHTHSLLVRRLLIKPGL